MFGTFRDDDFSATEWVNAALASVGSHGSRGVPSASDDTQISALIAKLQVLTQVRGRVFSCAMEREAGVTIEWVAQGLARWHPRGSLSLAVALGWFLRPSHPPITVLAFAGAGVGRGTGRSTLPLLPMFR